MDTWKNLILNVDPHIMLDVNLLCQHDTVGYVLCMKQSAATERVQKVAVSIILVDQNTRFTEYSFEMALVILNIDPLEVRKYCIKSLSSRHLNLDMLIYLKPIKISIK